LRHGYNWKVFKQADKLLPVMFLTSMNTEQSQLLAGLIRVIIKDTAGN